MERTYATYHVGLKILLRKEDDFLFLRNPVNQRFDLPGGRIDNIEDHVPLADVIAREVKEELGGNIRYELGKPVFQFRRHFESKGVHVFLTVYEAEYLSGDIELSAEHSDFEWINPKQTELKEQYFINQEEYLAFKEYFENIYQPT